MVWLLARVAIQHGLRTLHRVAVEIWQRVVCVHYPFVGWPAHMGEIMNDLLGNPIPASPSMTDPLPLVVWRITHERGSPEYWAARSQKEAEEAFADALMCEPLTCVESSHEYAHKVLADILRAGHKPEDGPYFLYGEDE